MAVKWDELLNSVEFASFGSGGEHEAYLCKETGAVFWRSAGNDLDELPDDVEDNEKYLRIPDKRKLDLGKPLVLDFAAQFLPDDYDEVRRIFSRRGAYGQFKGLLERRRALERWYAFEAEASERALREWCEINGIAIVD